MDPIPDLPPTIEPPAHIPHAAISVHHDHPTYTEMITSAISALNDKNGSSRQAIAKYIEKEYPNLPQAHSSLLTQHLKRLKNNGLLIMIKHSYALPRSIPLPGTEPDPNPDHHNTSPYLTDFGVPGAGAGVENNAAAGGVPSKRRPGRPPKPRPEFQPQLQAQVQQSYGGGVTGPVLHGHGVGGGNGNEPIFASLGLGDDAPAVDAPPLQTLGKRRRGRPAKVFDGSAAAGAGGAPAAAAPARVGRRGRGRPARPKLLSVLMGNGGGMKKKGRGRGRPSRIVPVTVPLSANNNAQQQPKARGRPRRGDSYVAEAGVNGGLDTSQVARTIRKLTGKPMGRPRKGAPGTAVLVTDPEQLVAYQELKTKLEYFQSKIKETVSVVKPRLNPEYEVIALGALQELEALATMDVTAPLHFHAQQQQFLSPNIDNSGAEGQGILPGF